MRPRSDRPAKIKPADYSKLQRIVSLTWPASVSKWATSIQNNVHENNYKRRDAKKKLVIKKIN